MRGRREKVERDLTNDLICPSLKQKPTQEEEQKNIQDLTDDLTSYHLKLKLT